MQHFWVRGAKQLETDTVDIPPHKVWINICKLLVGLEFLTNIPEAHKCGKLS